ncbi:hypothetical protein [Parabacteroides sp.]
MKKLLSFGMFVLLSASCYASDTTLQVVAGNLKRLYNLYPIEKIYIHQDRTIYRAGETMWLKVYQDFLSESEGKSQVVHLQLIDGYNRLVLEKQWPLRDGKAVGDVLLPDTLPTGNYQLRGYTNYMRNFGEEHFFTRELKIEGLGALSQIKIDFSVRQNNVSVQLNVPLKLRQEKKLRYCVRVNGNESRSYSFAADEAGDARFDILLPDEVKREDEIEFVLFVGEQKHSYPVPFKQTTELALLPEGGYCVEGLVSKVAVKLTGSNGKGLAAKGCILDLTDDEERPFHTSDLGFGSVYFQPEPGHEYVAVVDSLQLRVPMLEPLKQGIVQQIRYWNGRMRIMLSQNLGADVPVFLLIHHQGMIYYHAKLHLTEEKTVMDIAYDLLPAGPFTVTLYDGQDRVCSERLAFVKYPECMPVALSGDKACYGHREKVTLEVRVDSLLHRAMDGDFSLSVVRKELDPISERSNYYVDYYLGSELKGYIENPNSYFEERDSLSLSRLDLLLLTHGWRRYSLKNILQGGLLEMPYPVERSLGFSGCILDGMRLKPEEMEINALFKQDTIAQTFTFHPARGGVFRFSGFDFTGTSEMLLSVTDKQKNALDFTLMESKSPRSAYYSPLLTLQDSLAQLSVRMSRYGNVGKVKDIDKVVHELPEVTIMKRKKHTKSFSLHNEDFASHSYVVRENEHFSPNSMASLLSRVPGLKVYPSPDGLGTRIRVNGAVTTGGFSRGGGSSSNNSNENKAPTPVFKGASAGALDPVIVLDGVIDYIGYALQMDPNRVKKVEVLVGTAAMVYTRNSFAGVVVIHTKSWKDRIDSTPVKSKNYRFVGYDQVKEFYSPDYSLEKDRSGWVDERNTLYWNPSVTLNGEGKAELSFYTSDMKGEYEVICEGRSGGKIGIGRGVIVVK